MRLAAATQWLCLSLHLLCGTSLVAFTHPKPHLFVRRTSNAARANAPHHAFITRQQSTATNCRRAQTSSDDEHTSALALLAAVPVVWGTYAPLVKYTLSLDRAPPVLLFNLASYAASFAALAMTLFAARLPLMSWTALQGGMELGLWLFLGSTVQVYGLQDTTASRAAFLVQMTTVFVPILESIASRKALPPQLWLACSLALAGILCLSLPTADTLGFGVSAGDALILLSALFYSFHVCRLGGDWHQVLLQVVLTDTYAKAVPAAALAASKSAVEFALGVLGVCVLALTQNSQYESIIRYMSQCLTHPSTQDLVVGAAVLWNGVAVTAFPTWAQSKGQRLVAPTQANILYSLQPIASCVFSGLALHEEFLPTTLVAACLLGSAVGLSVQAGRPNEASPDV